MFMFTSTRKTLRMNTTGRLSLRLITAVGCMLQVQSYVVGNNPNDAILSRFAGVQCELLMTVGRTPNTAMPPEWAASGAKLGLPLEVKFSTKDCYSYEMNQDTLLGGVPVSFLAAVPLNQPSFTSVNGQETVKVTPGAFSCQIQMPETLQHSLRFFLDFPEGATRNDVVLPAGRIYFMTACWNADGHNMIERAKKWKGDIQKSLEQTNSDIEEMKLHPVGLLQKTLEFRQYFTLLECRRKLAAQMDILDETFPPDDRLVEGPNNMIFLKEGVIAVKRFDAGDQEQYHWVGTFTLKKLLLESDMGSEPTS